MYISFLKRKENVKNISLLLERERTGVEETRSIMIYLFVDRVLEPGKYFYILIQNELYLYKIKS